MLSNCRLAPLLLAAIAAITQRPLLAQTVITAQPAAQPPESVRIEKNIDYLGSNRSELLPTSISPPQCPRLHATQAS
ncbi:MAG UNVERIFIED_CONTAM: hypothetical protein LVR18_10320 [Planctomycetaceae bacterium]|jgi:hypothetical protein